MNMKEEDLINIADILRNAPVGIKLYSSAFGNCELGSVVKDEIAIYYDDECYVLDQYGRYRFLGECILFPHQYKHDWNGWQAWLFRDELSLGKVVVDTLGGYFIITSNEKDDIKVANSNGNEFLLDSKELDKFRFATQAERIEFFEYLERNHCNWDNETKTIFKISLEKDCTRIMNKQEEPKEFCDEDAKEAANEWCRCFKCDGIVNETGLKCSKTRLLTCPKWYDSYKASLIALETYKRKLKENKESKEPKNNSKFRDGDIVTVVKHNNGWTDYLIGIVIGPYIFGSDLSKMSINKALRFEIRYATEQEKHKFLSEWEEPKELYTDEEAKEFADKVSHEWWQMAMDKWNTLTEDEKKKYNQYIGFNDFSDHLMNILRSVLLGLKRNGKLIYEEGSLFSEPDQKLAEIELDETPNGVVCMPRVLDDQVQTITEDIAPKVSINSRFAKVEPSDSGCATKNNKYIPKLKVGDKACLSDKNDNIYFEEILKANDEEYYTKTFGWINCKAIDELHEINFKKYNKPFTIGDFKQFDKVLWRLGPTDTWTIGFFDNYYISGETDKVNYSVVGYEKDWVPQCVPYNIDTEYLHDTDEEYDGKYKTW